MKAKYYLFVTGIITILAMVSCSEDFLELTPADQVTTNNFYQEEADFNTAIAGAYGTLMGSRYADRLIWMLDSRSDNSFAESTRGNQKEISDFTAASTNTYVGPFYTTSYVTIQATNAILERIEAIEFNNDSDKNRIIAEALFLRSLSYFYLTQIFGDVPLVLSEATGSNLEQIQSIPRTPIADIYAQIIADLDLSITNYPDFDIPNRASVGSSRTLKGLVLMQRGDYADAVTELEQVVGNFELLPEFGDLFFGPGNNVESIFVIEHIGAAEGTGSGIGFQFRPTGSFGDFNVGNLGVYMEPNLFALYSENDSIRRDLTAKEVDGSGEEGSFENIYLNSKYDGPQPPFANNNGSNNHYVFRYGGVLLLYAEALNEVGYGNSLAFDALNQVRARAGLEMLSPAELTDQAVFRLEVLDERRRELAGESKRWLDLKRAAANNTIDVIALMNTYLSIANPAINATLDENDLLYAIPEGEILNNPDVVTQNPGY